MFAEKERGIEADHGGLLYGFQRRVFEFGRSESIAGRVDDMVEFRPAALFEKLDYVFFDGGRGKVARVAGNAALGAWVRFEEFVDAGVNAGLLGGGDDNRGAEFEAGFGDTVAYARAAADDEDAGTGELVAVFFAVGHVGGCFGKWRSVTKGKLAVDESEGCEAGR